MRRPTEENQMNPKLSFRGAAIAAVMVAVAAPRASAASAVNRVASVEVDGSRVVVHIGHDGKLIEVHLPALK